MSVSEASLAPESEDDRVTDVFVESAAPRGAIGFIKRPRRVARWDSRASRVADYGD